MTRPLRVAVTGSTGKLGRATVARLRAEGHEVLGLDIAGAQGAGFTRVDFTDYGQTIDALLGITSRHDGLDAVVHLAAIPVNGLVPDVTTFHNNLTVSFNVFHAAMRAGIGTIVSASSITAMGFPFTEAPPYLPIDEDVTAANNTYGLGKVLEEAMVAQLVRWDPDLSITALRFTNVVAADEYGTFARASDPSYRRDLMFSYIDEMDGALAVSLALRHARPGLEIYTIAASDSGSAIPSRELADLHFPGMPITADLDGFTPLVSIEKARRQLGFEPAHRWREEFPG
jgi:nucleoside-diphosphate-sugar epimerase